MHAAYSGSYLCERHFLESVERRVRKRIREDNLLPNSATPDDPQIWVIGLSGGKDSVVLTHILHETFEQDPRIELVALTIHEGIAGYRDKSLDASVDLAEDLGIEHVVASYDEEFDVRMDEVVETDPENMAACAYCGVFRRDLLSTYADEHDADKLLTGHHLDDEAETALMNFLEGNLDQIAKHFDASLGPFGEGDGDDGGKGGRSGVRAETESFVPRAKPLRDVPEKEVALYAQLKGLPVHMAECPHSSEAFRGEIQDLMLSLEENHPGTRHSIMAGYEELAAVIADDYGVGRGESDLADCEECGSPTTGEICRKCALVESIRAV